VATRARTRKLLRTDTLKWALARTLPMKYGDVLRHKGPTGCPVQVDHDVVVESEAELRERAIRKLRESFAEYVHERHPPPAADAPVSLPLTPDPVTSTSVVTETEIVAVAGQDERAEGKIVEQETMPYPTATGVRDIRAREQWLRERGMAGKGDGVATRPVVRDYAKDGDLDGNSSVARLPVPRYRVSRGGHRARRSSRGAW
jgi:hypothetical protein